MSICWRRRGWKTFALDLLSSLIFAGLLVPPTVRCRERQNNLPPQHYSDTGTSYRDLVRQSALSSQRIASPGERPVPQYLYSVHNQGNLQMTITNWGQFGVITERGVPDPVTGEVVNGLVYPRNIGVSYFNGDIAVGAIAGTDTLVTTWEEFSPDVAPFGEFQMASIDANRSFFSRDAHSIFDLTCTYFDTLKDTPFVPINRFDNRFHKPLGLRVIQRSMAWSGPNLDDFIIINYELGNTGLHFLHDVYVRFDEESFIYDLILDSLGSQLVGFLPDWHITLECGVPDTVNVAYVTSYTGFLHDFLDDWDTRSPRAAVGIQVLGMPADSLRLNYNWYAPSFGGFGTDTAATWGPRRRGTVEDPFRQIGESWGRPEGDANEYYVMAHPEFDYDQMYAAVDFSSRGWLPPSVIGWLTSLIPFGIDAKASLSFGPIDLPPRASTEFTIAVVGGDSVHVHPNDFLDRWDIEYPDAYYHSLDFSRLAENARWAKWVYDNPGFDTDGDGYRGKFRICNGDTFWYEGDGVPDFRADVPPLAPKVHVLTRE
ncbi:MAG: hypothetical protein D6800_03530, partial [Candidatus Zixiibacteriota bacterium]